jgi:hypothetical protein
MRRPKTANIMVAVVIVASVGVIYAMRLHGMGLGMTLALDNIPSIDYDLEKRPGNEKEQQRILRQLKNLDPIQNQHGALNKNPFRLTEGEQHIPIPKGRDPQDPALLAQIREAEIKTAFGSLELEAVMNGRIPIAKINKKIVKVGDTVTVGEVVFTVTSIHDRTAELQLEGKVYALSMADPAVTQQNNP